MDLAETEPLLVVGAIVTGLLWLLATLWLYVSRLPAEPPAGPKTLDLGPEPPAIASFLVHDFRVTDDAVPATLLDLAARDVVEVEQRGPGVFYVRLRAEHDEILNAYERRVLDHLQGLAVDGVVPAEALTTGPAEQSTRWRSAFASEVVTDAKLRGLSRDAVDGPAFTALTALSLVPGVLVWILSDFYLGALVVVGAVALLGWIRARHPQRETPDGLEAASRWLGVRSAIAEDEEFKRHTPLTVAIWDRHLAYGAALGVAQGAIGPLPMGVESDMHAWSSYGGRWRPVRVVYPRLWPPGWGKDPLVTMVAAFGVIAVAILILYTLGPALVEAGAIGRVLLVVPSLALVVGVATVLVAWWDWLSSMEVTGPILRLRVLGDENNRRHYVAVDDGTSRSIRAWQVDPKHYHGLRQGQVITARLTKNLCCVRWIVTAEAAASAV